MRVLVPLPFDLSNSAHGRNLRVVHVLDGLSRRSELFCLTPDERLAEAVRRTLPDVPVRSADPRADTPVATRAIYGGPRWLDRAVSFLGFDQRLDGEVCRSAAAADVVLGFDMPSVSYLLSALRSAARAACCPRVVCDLIDDPWLLRKSFPRSQRWSASGLKAAAATWVVRRRVLPLFDSLIAVASRDATSLSRTTGRYVSVIPNGVDTPTCLNGGHSREMMAVFTGGMGFPSNEAAACFLARRVWPLVLQRYREQIARSDPQVSRACSLPTLAIVGADPTPRVRRLGAEPSVIVTGRVPSVCDWLTRARVAVAPMVSGCGIKNKILEACAAGCPVVSTSLGAAGLPTGEENGIVVRDRADHLADEITRLLLDAAAARRIGSAGQDMVRDRFAWSGVADAFLRVLQGEVAATIPTADEGTSIRPAPLTGVVMLEQGCTDHEEALAHAAS